MTAPRRPRSAWLLVGSTAGVWVEGPERRPAVEEVGGELAVVLRPWAFPGGVFEQRAERGLERRDLRLEAGTIGVSLVAVPGGEEVAGDPEAVAAELFLLGHAFAV